MFTRLVLGTVLLAATVVSGVPPRRVYAVRWNVPREGTAEQRALIDQVDRRLRDELQRRGASVVDAPGLSPAIVLKPSLEIFPTALKLSVVGVRATDQKLLGTISAKAAGSTRDAQLKALVSRTCLEADQL